MQGHSPDERKTVPGKRNVMILEVNPVGNYAVRLVFDDMHSTGIFSWDYLLELGRNQPKYWQDYLDELAAKGMTRDRAHERRKRGPVSDSRLMLRMNHRITMTFAPTFTRL